MCRPSTGTAAIAAACARQLLPSGDTASLTHLAPLQADNGGGEPGGWPGLRPAGGLLRQVLPVCGGPRACRLLALLRVPVPRRGAPEVRSRTPCLQGCNGTYGSQRSLPGLQLWLSVHANHVWTGPDLRSGHLQDSAPACPACMLCACVVSGATLVSFHVRSVGKALAGCRVPASSLSGPVLARPESLWGRD